MVVRKRTGSTARGNAKPTTRRAPAKQAAPKAVAKPTRDVTQYADKEPTPYHKAFATWLIREVGVELDGLSAKAAFLKGVSVATAARPAFGESDFLENWREKQGINKRGPKRTEAETTRRKTRQVVSDEEFEDEEEELDEDEVNEDEDDTDEDEDFDEEDEDDSEDDSEDDEDDEDDDFDEEEEEAPAPKRRSSSARTAKPVARTSKSAPAKKAAPTRGTRNRSAGKGKDDGFLF